MKKKKKNNHMYGVSLSAREQDKQSVTEMKKEKKHKKTKEPHNEKANNTVKYVWWR